MKKITPLILGLFLFTNSNILADNDILFEENFSYITETFYGNAILEPEDFEIYFENEGWTGENVVLGAGAASGGPIFNEINKPRVSFWQGENDHLTTPAVNCPAEVTLMVQLKRCCRWNDGSLWDFGQAKVLHAADGENFELLETVDLPQNTPEDPHSFTDFSFDIKNATANSKFRFQVAQFAGPNRFFVGSVIVQTGGSSSLTENLLEASIKIYADEIIIGDEVKLSDASIYNASGVSVYQGNVNVIDTSSLPQGAYILQTLGQNGERGVTKFIKQ